MEIRRIDKTINEILKGSEYLGCGASKEAYAKNRIVYKVPRGRYLLEDNKILENLTYPNTMEEVNGFLSNVEAHYPQLVWPLGQFAIELLVWEAIQQLEQEGIAINCIAKIKDYYFDATGVLVIEQEETTNYYNSEFVETDDEREKVPCCESSYWEEMKEELDYLAPVLEERFNIKLRDITSYNCGMGEDKRMKLFDFGISSSTNLDYYGSYSDYMEDSEW